MPDVRDLRHWSHSRQLLGRRGGSPEAVLRAIVGVYSSHPTGPLSLHARSRKLTARSFAKLEEERKALRVAAMRLSVYVLPSETARLAVAATTPAPDDPFWEKRYSVKGRAIPKSQYALWRKKVLSVARRPLSIGEIRDVAGLPGEMAKPVLNRMAFEGHLLRVAAPGLRSSTLRYVAASRWYREHRLPGAKELKARDEAVRWLVREYLRAFGPARIADFRWWAGITATRARGAIEALETVSVGDDQLLLARDAREFERFKRPKGDCLDLLPQWDSYTMGYAPDGRARFIDPSFQDRLYASIGATGGNALGAVLVNGLVHGVWKLRSKGDRMIVTLSMFDRPAARLKRDIRSRLEAIANLLDAKSLELVEPER